MKKKALEMTSQLVIFRSFFFFFPSLDPKYVTKFPANQLIKNTGPRSAVGNVSGYRCVSDCNSRGRMFDPGPVPYFRGD